MTSSKFRKNIMILQLIVVSCVFIIPFIKTSNGNSLIRFDIPSSSLFFFNHIIDVSNFFLLFLSGLWLTFVLILLTQLFGRVWCGFLCPQSFFSLIIEKVKKKYKNKKLIKPLEIMLGFLFAVLLTTVWFMYFISPYDFFNIVFGSSSNTALILWVITFSLLFLDFGFIRFKWCKYLCPYSKFQYVMTDNNTMYVGMKHGRGDDCLKCMACVKGCPLKIDPRKNPDADCIYCGLCIDVCNKIFKKKNKNGILFYVFGIKNELYVKRLNLIITSIITTVLTIVFIYHLVGVEPISVKYNSIEKISSDTYLIKAIVTSNLDKPAQVMIEQSECFDILEYTPIMFKRNKNVELTLSIRLKKDNINSTKLKLLYNYNKPPVLSEVKLK